jgi:anthranilate synthase component 1
VNVFPDKSQFLKLAQQGNIVPVYTEMMADFETPVSVYAKLAKNGPAYLLESIEGGAHLARYSFIGYNPRRIFECELGGRTRITERNGSISEIPTPQDPLKLIEAEMAQYQPVKFEDMPPFMGGAVGYIGYEYIHVVEPSVPLARKNPLQMPVMHFMLTDTVVIYDRARQTLRLLTNAHIEGDPEASYDAALQTLRELSDHLRQDIERPTFSIPAIDLIEVPQGNFAQADFEKMVEDCKEYIRAGDIIQVVGSQRFEKPYNGTALDLYRALRIINPSPYMVLYQTADFALIAASPEVHVKLTGTHAEVRPIAGTRPRGHTNAEDIAFEKDLLADEKERAEHLMLVDLARNDLGRVCRYGSVCVPEYMVIERYSHVMHIVSQVEGELSPDYSVYDLVRATFPAGTVSGAPKVRAMQIIAEKESDQRGSYAGAIAYFSYDGNLDSCIAIRTALLKNNTLYIQSGAGLVADSIPVSEYQETINKAKGMLKAVELAQKMR